MKKDLELKKWKEIWGNGLLKAEKTTEKNEDEYKICSSPNIPLLDNELIKNEEWLEILEKTLLTNYPSVAFEYWAEKGWLKHALPELMSLYGVPQTEKYHPEIDCGIHTMMVLDRSAANDFSLRTRYFALFHDFGKGITPSDILPSHYGHEKGGEPLVKFRLQYFNLPEKFKKEITQFTYYHGVFHDIKVVKPKKLYGLIKEMGFNENLLLANDFCNGLVSDSEGRKGYFYKPHPNAYILNHVMQEWMERMPNFEKSFEEFWLMKSKKTKEKTGRDISQNEEFKLSIKENFEKSFYVEIITKVIASYYPDNVIKNKHEVKRKSQ